MWRIEKTLRLMQWFLVNSIFLLNNFKQWLKKVLTSTFWYLTGSTWYLVFLEVCCYTCYYYVIRSRLVEYAKSYMDLHGLSMDSTPFFVLLFLIFTWLLRALTDCPLKLIQFTWFLSYNICWQIGVKLKEMKSKKNPFNLI